MQNLLYNISQVLGITIIHSLWQGLIIFIVLRLFMLVFPARSAALKYWVSYGALTFMLGWFVVTLFKELNYYNWLSTTALQLPPLTLPAIIHAADAPTNRLYFTISGYMPYLTMLYVVGLVFNTLKLTLAWNSIYRIRQNINDAGFDNTVKRLSASLAIRQEIQAAFSEWVDVPCVTGFIKPIVLLPISITCHLSTEEIEAVLLHELAHIKRNDYLLNFVQQVIGILLFFNPFARLVSGIISKERENCCDDIVVRVTGSPFIYAQALLKLEENKQQQWQLALAATGKKYELLTRIERIMKTKTQTVNIRPVLITLLALTCSLSSIAWLNPEIKDGRVIIKNAPAIKMVTAAITGPAEIPAPAERPTVKHQKHLTFKLVADTTKPAALMDTIIKNKKYKIVIEDGNGNKKEYNSVNDLPAEDRENFLGKGADINFGMSMADSARMLKIRKFYESDEWKKQAELMAVQGKKMAEHFNSPEWKKQQKALVEKSLAMAKMVTDKKWQKQSELIARESKKMTEQFNSPEWKKQMKELAESGTGVAKYFESPAWKKQIKEIAKAGEDMGKYYDSPEGKKYLQDLQKFGEDMGKYYDSPEGKKYLQDLQKRAGEISGYYNSPEEKEKLDEMEKDTTRKAKGYGMRKTIPAKAPRPPKTSKSEQLPPPPRPAKELKGKQVPPPPPAKPEPAKPATESTQQIQPL
ncbi:M56 family metallopeptidase [Mucilaginibacter sp. UR6-11]|uniref:M56 family metallopeptidase n=1 Tax=Mucilaginibacter sp. UR6-11 TaxID=1435644 RepID=UPI001E4BBF31|nr:M56 family metallopeptidase [Mucilaginibacter sp. UR6-11]MCC8427262.1 M48 family metalloprotease [Mucilaginibacter sp. UR6-11]